MIRQVIAGTLIVLGAGPFVVLFGLCIVAEFIADPVSVGLACGLSAAVFGAMLLER